MSLPSKYFLNETDKEFYNNSKKSKKIFISKPPGLNNSQFFKQLINKESQIKTIKTSYYFNSQNSMNLNTTREYPIKQIMIRHNNNNSFVKNNKMNNILIRLSYGENKENEQNFSNLINKKDCISVNKHNFKKENCNISSGKIQEKKIFMGFDKIMDNKTINYNNSKKKSSRNNSICIEERKNIFKKIPLQRDLKSSKSYEEYDFKNRSCYNESYKKGKIIKNIILYDKTKLNLSNSKDISINNKSVSKNMNNFDNSLTYFPKNNTSRNMNNKIKKSPNKNNIDFTKNKMSIYKKMNNTFIYKKIKNEKPKSISRISDVDNISLNQKKNSKIKMINNKVKKFGKFSLNNSLIIRSEDIPIKKIQKKIYKIDSCTLPSYNKNGVKQKNLDNFFLQKNFLSKDEQFFIGICDGHGSNGDLISKYISDTLYTKVKYGTKNGLIKAFLSTNDSLIKESKIDCSLSGTTCTSLLISLDKVICANVGNTRAILAKYENGYYNCIKLCSEHKPSEPNEIKRIIKEGGIIRQKFDFEKNDFFGPDKIWIKNSDIPGLNISRSFGDNLAHSIGVIHEPDVNIINFTGGEKFIVVASDSIWQYIDNDECIGIIKNYYENNFDAGGALNSLANEAIKRWMKEEKRIEDMTAIVIFFE